MMPDPARVPIIAVLGGGISGLATAHFLSRDAGQIAGVVPDIHVLEASPRFGGVIRSVRDGDFLLEGGPDAFGPGAALFGLIRELGLEICPPLSPGRRMYVSDGRRLTPTPDGMAGFAPVSVRRFWSTAAVSRRGKLRALAEPLVPRSRGDISVRRFLRRRLGKELSREVVEPLASAILGGRLDGLSAASSLGFLHRLEQTHGSLFRASRSRPGRRGPGAPPLWTLQAGLEDLVHSLTEKLADSVRLRAGWPVSHLARRAGCWLVSGPAGRLSCDVVILCLPAEETARLLDPLQPEAASLLREIPYRSPRSLYLAYQRRAVGHPLDAAGFVVKDSADSVLSCCSFVSSKFDGRNPPGTALLRCTIRPTAGEASVRLAERVEREVARHLAIEGPPLMTRWFHHRRALPVLAVGHSRLLGNLFSLPVFDQGLVAAGSWAGGVGISDCAETASRAAHRALLFLNVNDIDCRQPTRRAS